MIDFRVYIYKAEEVSEKRKFSSAMLRVDVVPSGTSSSPRLVADSLEGFVEESAPVGTAVVSTRARQPLQLKVVGGDDDGDDGDQVLVRFPR